MKRKLIKIGLIIVVISIIICVLLYWLNNAENNYYQKRGKLLIDKIETFRQIEKRLPDNVIELGLEEPMSAGPYYEKKDSVNYIIFFTIGFDNAKIYYSDKKEWKDEH
jgi:hypothetical protein